MVRGKSRVSFVLAVSAAGLLVAQSARIHPVCWVPAAFLPFVVLVGPGDMKGRVFRALLAVGGIAAFTAVFAGGWIWHVLQSPLADHHLTELTFATCWGKAAGALAVFGPLAILVAAAARNRRP